MPTENDTPAPTSATLTHGSPCPSCKDPGIWRESVDVGVGVIYGPFGCECGWSEAAEYDVREGPAKANEQYSERSCDQWGVAHWVGPKTQAGQS